MHTLDLNLNEWKQMEITELPLETALDIIDDALCFSYEFKVENNNIYFRHCI